MKRRLLIGSLLIFSAILPAQAENAATWSMNQLYPMTQLNAIERTKQIGVRPGVTQLVNPLFNLLNNAIWACSYSYCYSQTNFN